MGEVILSLQHISKNFGEGNVLDDISLDVERGEFITLLGASGCGKTTTLRIISGLETPNTGTVFLAGKDVTKLPPESREVNTVFQSYALFPHMNVEKNVAYGLKLRGMPKAQIAQRVDEMLRLVQMEDFKKRMPAQLSGGQRQRVAIARALAPAPQLLLLDEPLGALDLQLRRAMQVELKRLQKQLGITFIYITHDQEEALNMSDRIAVMRGGKFEQIGTPEEIYEHPATRYCAQFIGRSTLFEATVKAIDGDVAQVETEQGNALCPAANLKVGDQVLLCVRTERLRYATTPVEGFSITGEATLNRYTGGALITHVRLADGREVAASGDGRMADAPQSGTKLYLYWPAQAACVVGGGAHA